MSVESPFLVSLLSLLRAVFCAVAPLGADTSLVVVSGHDRVLGMPVDELARITSRGFPALRPELECVARASHREMALFAAVQVLFLIKAEEAQPQVVVFATRKHSLFGAFIALLCTIDDVDRSAKSCVINICFKVFIVWLPVACHDVMHAWLRL